MMKKEKGLLFFCIVLLVGGCDQQPETVREKQPEQNKITRTSETTPEAVKPQKIQGQVLGTQFEPDKVLIRNGNILLRQGKEFFPDLAAEIVFFGNVTLENTTIDSRTLEQGTLPHIRLEIRKEGENLPDTQTFLNEYALFIQFSQASELGIPFQVRFSHEKSKTAFEGAGVATFKDIKVTDGKIDLTDDSWDTLDVLSKRYVDKLDKSFTVNDSFGLTIQHFGGEFPKTGFVGYEITTEDGVADLLKLQLQKDASGWKVVRRLSNDQIHQAHALEVTVDRNERTLQGQYATEIAAKELEKFLNASEDMSSVRATSMRCYLTGASDRASCKGVYGVKLEEEIVCKNKNYLMIRDAEEWQIFSEIEYDQQVDYTSGELVKKKPFRMNC